MQCYVIYTHVLESGIWYHQPFTYSYAETIDEAIDHFCLLTKLKFPTFDTYQFCIHPCRSSEWNTQMYAGEETVGVVLNGGVRE